MTRPVLAIDTGTRETAFAFLKDEQILQSGKQTNESVLQLIRTATDRVDVVLEMIASYGMAVGKETFETVFWIGRFAEAAHARGHHVDRRVRLEVKLHHCHNPRANDSTIRQVLIDRFGGKGAAIGLKKNPGPLYGVKADIWQALALGLMFVDEQKEDATIKTAE